MDLDATWATWLLQYDDLHARLEPWVVTLEDGWQGVDPSAPAGLLELYGKMQSVGYAKGWL